jgi:hypothetical protein
VLKRGYHASSSLMALGLPILINIALIRYDGDYNRLVSMGL